MAQAFTNLLFILFLINWSFLETGIKANALIICNIIVATIDELYSLVANLQIFFRLTNKKVKFVFFFDITPLEFLVV